MVVGRKTTSDPIDFPTANQFIGKQDEQVSGLAKQLHSLNQQNYDTLLTSFKTTLKSVMQESCSKIDSKEFEHVQFTSPKAIKKAPNLYSYMQVMLSVEQLFKNELLETKEPEHLLQFIKDLADDAINSQDFDTFDAIASSFNDEAVQKNKIISQSAVGKFFKASANLTKDSKTSNYLPSIKQFSQLVNRTFQSLDQMTDEVSTKESKQNIKKLKTIIFIDSKDFTPSEETSKTSSLVKDIQDIQKGIHSILHHQVTDSKVEISKDLKLIFKEIHSTETIFKNSMENLTDFSNQIETRLAQYSSSQKNQNKKNILKIKLILTSLKKHSEEVSKASKQLLKGLPKELTDETQLDKLYEIYTSEAFKKYAEATAAYIKEFNSYNSLLELFEKINLPNTRLSLKNKAQFIPSPSDLGGIFILPIQRMPRHQLLLTDLAKKMEKGSNFQIKTSLAKELVVTYAKEINSTV